MLTDEIYPIIDIIDMDTKKIYEISRYIPDHRENPNIIQFLFERADKLTVDEFNNVYDNILCSYTDKDELNDLLTEDKQKRYTLENWKTSKTERFISCLITIGISGRNAELNVALVKSDLTWRISEYDGIEEVVISHNYYKIISSLVRELQMNNIKPSVECPELLSNLITGKITLEEFKKYESSN
jgi:hypothetical protein